MAENKIEDRSWENHHPKLLNIELQNAYDTMMAREVLKLTDEEQEIYARSAEMSSLIRELSYYRKDKTETDQIELSDELVDRIKSFKEEMWLNLREHHEGIVTDNHAPFPDEILGKIENKTLTGRDLDNMMDNLHTLLDLDQNTVSHITRDLKRITDTAYHLSVMTAEQAKQKDLFVRNQRV